MTELSASRKDDHIKFALEQAKNRSRQNDFDSLRFVHHALNAIDITNTGLETEVFGAKWKMPIYINAMTGGSSKSALINESLARVAAETKIPVASGSMSQFFKDHSTAKSFSVLRDLNPNGTVFANVNANATVDEAKRAIELLQANALQIHINSVQELAMAEGDRLFSHWAKNIEKIVNEAPVPVIVKEVGFGISFETLIKLKNLGVQAIDTAGRGGTNFAAIEQQRVTDSTQETFLPLQSWGLSTVESLLDCLATQQLGLTVFASGGVRNSLDVAKALALGATAVGVAGGFLHTLEEHGEEALITQITQWQDNLVTVQALLGIEEPAKMSNSQLLITDGVAEFCIGRKIDVAQYATRGREGQITANV